MVKTLSISTFFDYYIRHPLKAPSQKERIQAMVASVALGVFCLGICHMASWLVFSNRKTERWLPSQDTSQASKTAKTVDSLFTTINHKDLSTLSSNEGRAILNSAYLCSSSKEWGVKSLYLEEYGKLSTKELISISHEQQKLLLDILRAFKEKISSKHFEEAEICLLKSSHAYAKLESISEIFERLSQSLKAKNKGFLKGFSALIGTFTNAAKTIEKESNPPIDEITREIENIASVVPPYALSQMWSRLSSHLTQAQKTTLLFIDGSFVSGCREEAFESLYRRQERAWDSIQYNFECVEKCKEIADMELGCNMALSTLEAVRRLSAIEWIMAARFPEFDPKYTATPAYREIVQKTQEYLQSSPIFISQTNASSAIAAQAALTLGEGVTLEEVKDDFAFLTTEPRQLTFVGSDNREYYRPTHSLAEALGFFGKLIRQGEYSAFGAGLAPSNFGIVSFIAYLKKFDDQAKHDHGLLQKKHPEWKLPPYCYRPEGPDRPASKTSGSTNILKRKKRQQELIAAFSQELTAKVQEWGYAGFTHWTYEQQYDVIGPQETLGLSETFLLHYRPVEGNSSTVGSPRIEEIKE